MFRLLTYQDGNLSFSLPDEPTDKTTSKHRFTVIIGANGTGKSQILRSIVSHYQKQIANKYFKDSNEKFFIDGTTVIGAPSTVLALSNMAIDVFPYSLKRDQTYRYLGLKQNNNSMSTGSLRDSTVASIILCMSDPERTAMLAPTLETLGFNNCQAAFSRPLPASVRNRKFDRASIVRTFLGNLPHLRKDENLSRTAGELTARLDEFGAALPENAATGGPQRNYIQELSEISTSFGIDLTDLSRLLKRARIADVDVHLSRGDSYFGLDDLSAGQLLLLSTFSRLAANIGPDTLILIDEPETGLHPNWQSAYIPLLEDTVPAAWSCHFFLGTHSPHIVSDGSDVLVPGAQWGEFVEFMDPFNGRAVENILYRVFGAKVSGNSLVDDDLTTLIEYLASPDSEGLDSEEVQRAVSRLRKISGPDTEVLNSVLNDLPQVMGGQL
ncbi:putative ATPase [Pseudarthrobacter oxydans]|uniref:ATP-binding protein n=1 Tax=Pseudarthrobacter oxydans TaxID=1671 RepID=UPI00278797E2|nr:ATP-binding protein [Pseudarthrobacter oxydans]MDP9983883.1 putative ATPase [Pseudarthrobacter oxydans]